MIMPASVTHYLFAERVLNKLKQTGAAVTDRDAALIGAQGPDVFFFHRVMPWQPGVSYAREGNRMHHISPARLFELFRQVLNAESRERGRMQSYIEGFFCHYALDRTAHPYVFWFQEELAAQRPRYGRAGHTYHFHIESALETLMLRRDTGRRVEDYPLQTILPRDDGSLYLTIGRLFVPVFLQLWGLSAPAERLALAPGDMRRVLFFLTDRSAVKQTLLRPLEWVSGQGHFATSLFRPLDVSDWDYANEEKKEWKNPFDLSYTSRESFYDLYDLAADEAVDMILAFRQAIPRGQSMLEITQDRGFSSDLPGKYASYKGKAEGKR